ncbi:D-alanyl-D-alanine carboxypeptidase/D-alanyl-D-alanine-endopeptidase [Planctomyces sp. SH-PL62]|uniref:D-alanyl-D-alanine carboxypeptidase/D-alanyl-D-alanine endopeptidase n=1 Tax=Planctomyces sp. SH-PL62 TaxID=1636152 RepID=UPI00078D9EE9|nr:D-alanyl-D-alanine carboxypeptidase/D-alanyl-D-alanine-endopeptidase [Planctomyces sp. SH-PL62]AMV40623.1 D-alanyl-D-alanine carboxypeptidase precursor [Planctomyces sp. SH-PL62]
MQQAGITPKERNGRGRRRSARLGRLRQASALFMLAVAALAIGIDAAAARAQEAPKPSQEAPKSASAPATTATTRLEDRVKAVLENPTFRRAHWGILVVDSKTGETVYEKNPDELFGTASVAKLFSTAAAMVELGADHRFQTPVVRRGNVDDQGALHGDLILIAQGDPAMGGRTGPDGKLLFTDEDHIYTSGGKAGEVLVQCDPLAGLEHLARETRAAGIKKIDGEVIVDARLFERAPSSGSGPRLVSPIMINDNLIDVVVAPGKAAGDPATVTMTPGTGYVAVDAQVETVADGSPQIRIELVGPRRIKVRGRVPAGADSFVDNIEVDDPASFARTLLIESLRRHGVQVSASPLADNPESDLPPQATLASLPKVAEYTSPPFREFARVILKVSHNLHASTLPLLLAVRKGERTLAAGLKRQGEILKGLGLDPLDVSFGGGAGGMWADMTTPRAAVTLLKAMADRPDFGAYDAALPILGRDGTLAKAVPEDSPARGHAHAKTGTMFVTDALIGKRLMTSKALAGYLETAAGRPLVIAFFINNVILDSPDGKIPTTTDAGKLLGQLCEAFYLGDGLAPAAPAGSPAPAATPAGGK